MIVYFFNVMSEFERWIACPYGVKYSRQRQFLTVSKKTQIMLKENTPQ